MTEIEKLARELHNEYERLAQIHQWATQKECRVDFKDLPESNKKTMIRLAKHINKREIEARKDELFSTLGTKGIVIKDGTFIQERISELKQELKGGVNANF